MKELESFTYADKPLSKRWQRFEVQADMERFWRRGEVMEWFCSLLLSCSLPGFWWDWPHHLNFSPAPAKPFALHGTSLGIMLTLTVNAFCTPRISWTLSNAWLWKACMHVHCPFLFNTISTHASPPVQVEGQSRIFPRRQPRNRNRNGRLGYSSSEYLIAGCKVHEVPCEFRSCSADLVWLQSRSQLTPENGPKWLHRALLSKARLQYLQKSELKVYLSTPFLPNGRHRTDDKSKVFFSFLFFFSLQKESHSPKLGKMMEKYPRGNFFCKFHQTHQSQIIQAHAQLKAIRNSWLGFNEYPVEKTVIPPQFCRCFPACWLCTTGERMLGIPVENGLQAQTG